MTANSRWQFAFLDEVLNQDNIIISSSEAVVLRDSYPKAEFHFLVVPKTEIENVFALNHSHLPLLDDMYDLANKVIKSETHLDPKEFLIGFKMDALMKQLNLHVISNDFISTRLKTNRHWTNFHTRVFLPFRIAYGTLKMKGAIKPLSPEELEFERKRPLVCNQCDFVTNHIFPLKTHLMKHWYEKQDQQKISVVAVTSKVDEVESQNLPTSTSALPATSSTNVQPIEAQRTVIQHSTSKELTQNLLPLENLINLKKLNQTERETTSSQELPKTSAKAPAPSMLVRLMEAQRAAITDSSSNGRAETSSTNLNTLKESNQTETEKAADQETSKSPPSASVLLSKESTPSTLVRMMEAQRATIQGSKECAETSSPQINLITLDELNESVKAMQLSNIPTVQDSLTQAKLKLIFDTAKQKSNAGRGRWTMPNKRFETNTLGQQSANNHGLPKSSPPVFNNVTPANQITWRNPFKQPTPLLTNGTLNNDGGKVHFKKQKQPYKPRAGSAPPGKAIPNASFVESRPPSVQQANNYHQPVRNNTGDGGKFHFKKPKHPYKLVAAGPAALEKPIQTASVSTAIESGATTSAESRPPPIQQASNQYKKSYKKPNQRFPKKEFHDTLPNGATQDQDVRKSFNNKKKWQPNANYTPRTLNHHHQPNNGKPTNVPTNLSDEVMKW